MLTQLVWALATSLAITAGWTDWRFRRIPNWLTLPGLVLGIVANTVAGGWHGTKESLLGALLGLAVLLPFVLIRSLGGGDWKLVGALGAFLGPHRLLTILLSAVIVAGVMAVILIVWKRRIGQTLRNVATMLGAFATLRLPGKELSLDSAESLKLPFGVAVAVTMVLYTAKQLWAGF